MSRQQQLQPSQSSVAAFQRTDVKIEDLYLGARHERGGRHQRHDPDQLGAGPAAGHGQLRTRGPAVPCHHVRAGARRHVCPPPPRLTISHVAAGGRGSGPITALPLPRLRHRAAASSPRSSSSLSHLTQCWSPHITPANTGLLIK